MHYAFLVFLTKVQFIRLVDLSHALKLSLSQFFLFPIRILIITINYFVGSTPCCCELTGPLHLKNIVLAKFHFQS